MLKSQKMKKKTMVSTFKIKYNYVRKIKLNSYVPPKEFKIDEEVIQKNTPNPRRGHQMAMLRGSSFIMTGGVTMPEAGPRIDHPHDSSCGFWTSQLKCGKSVKTVSA